MLKKKNHGELEWLEDENGYYICAWCPKKAETEEYLKSQEMALQFLYAIRAILRTDKPIKHSICEVHKQELLADYFKGGRGT